MYRKEIAWWDPGAKDRNVMITMGPHYSYEAVC